MRMRAYWVRKQTEMKNKIRTLLALQREDIRLEVEKRESGLFSLKGLEFVARLPLETREKEVLEDLLKGYQEIQTHIKTSVGMVNGIYGEIEEASWIDTVPGFAKMLSVLVAVEIAHVKRFPGTAELHSYAGVIPSTYSSGQRAHHGHITKQGSSWLRWAALEAVHPAIKKDPVLRTFCSRLARRKGPNVAKIAVARRLLTIIYRMLTEKRDYLPGLMKQSAA